MSYHSYWGSHRSGAALSHPDMPQMDPSYIYYRDHTVDFSEWEQHFNSFLFLKKNTGLAKPCMYLGRPYWRGGMVKFSEIKGLEVETICDFDGKLITVPFAAVVDPTLTEYNRYHRAAVEKMLFVVGEDSYGPYLKKRSK